MKKLFENWNKFVNDESDNLEEGLTKDVALALLFGLSSLTPTQQLNGNLPDQLQQQLKPALQSDELKSSNMEELLQHLDSQQRKQFMQQLRANYQGNSDEAKFKNFENTLKKSIDAQQKLVGDFNVGSYDAGGERNPISGDDPGRTTTNINYKSLPPFHTKS